MQKEQREKLLIKNEPESFEAYMAEHGKNADALYLDAKASSDAMAEMSSTDHGSLSESLSSSGLSGGGYEDYLRSRVELSSQARLDAARHERELTKLENRSGYAKYLSRHDAVQAKLSEELIDKLSLETNPDYDKMLDAAVNAGLTEERAVLTASKAYEKATDNAVYRAIYFAKRNSMTPMRAKKYAISIGLTGKLASRVYEAVFVLSSDNKENYRTLSDEEYNEYIKQLAEARNYYDIGSALNRKTN